MSTRNRGATYGRKKGNNDLLSAFGALRISPQQDEELHRAHPRTEREVLKEKSRNEGFCPPKSMVKVVSDQKPEQRSQAPTEQKKNHTRRRNEDQAQRKEPKIPPPSQSQKKPTPPSTTPLDPLPIPQDLLPLLSLPTTHPIQQPLSTLLTTLTTHFIVRKIAQGSYASIYRLSLQTVPSSYTIWKLIPLRPTTGRGSRLDGCTSFTDAVSEIKLLNAFSAMPGFVEMRATYLLHGAMPETLRKVDEEWWEGLSEGEREEIGEGHGRRGWEEGQWWCWVEMSDAGVDLEGWVKARCAELGRKGRRGKKGEREGKGKGRVRVEEVWDIFWGVTEAVAHGEEHAGFEHRDLHPGNVCIRQRATPPLAASPSPNPKFSRSEGPEDAEAAMVTRFTNLEITLIDYTLSRASIALPSSPNSHNDQTTETLAPPLRDNALFTQHSPNPIDERQFDTYRRMRDIMHSYHKPSQRKEGWKTFMPETNVAWVGHLLWVLLDAAGFSFDDDGGKIEGKEEEGLEETGEGGEWLRGRLGDLWRLLDPDRKWGEGGGFKSAGEVLAWEVLGMGEEDVGRACEEDSDVT